MNTNIEIVRNYLRYTPIESPRQLVEGLNACGTLLNCWSVADGISQRTLRRYLPRRVRANAYTDFDIPKKSGGVRHISAPIPELKAIQQALNLLLQSIAEISPSATGFVAGVSVVDNARCHIGQTVIFNCDLQNFFPSISKDMVRRALYRHLERQIPSVEVVSMLCSIATVPDDAGREHLPQGAPTSPVLSNIVLTDLDFRLEGYAARYGLRYSRYADDITFSHIYRRPKALQTHIDHIFSIIKDCGFTVNPCKTTIATTANRREVTGLTVGDKVNVSRSYVKQLRTILHLWETRGFDEAQAIYTRDFCHGIATPLNAVVNGKINYLAMVKGRTDSTYRRFKYRYRQLMHQLKEHQNAQ